MPRHPSLAILALVRNEASRWLPSILDAWSDFADAILVLDDNSTDDTPAVLQACPKVEYRKKLFDPQHNAWGHEQPARQELFNLGRTSGADWLFVLDADMVPARDPRPLLHAAADAVAFRLYDLWGMSPLTYRCDDHWQAHLHPRVWMVRNPGTMLQDEWNQRGIHCGHLPVNLPLRRCITAPEEYSLLHYAYSDATARKLKHQQYMDKQQQLTQQEWLHAASIVDPKPSLAMLPFTPAYPVTKASA